MSKRKKNADPPTSWWPTVILGALVVILPFVVLYWTVPFVGSTSIGNDYVLFPTAHQQELMYSVSHGTWPLYVPGFAGGRPAAALTLGQLFHPISHVASRLPGYWSGNAIEVNTFLRFLSLGLTQLVLLYLLRAWGLRLEIAFLLSFVTVYNMRMLDLFRFGAALENYTGHLLLCGAVGMSYLRPTRLVGPAAILGSTYLLVVGGHPQMFYLAFLGNVLFAALTPFVTAAARSEPRPAWARVARFYGATAVCMLAGVLLASAYTVPFYFDYVVETPGRAAMDYEWSLLNTDSWGGELNSFFRPLHVSAPGAFGGCSIILLALLTPVCWFMRRTLPWAIVLTWGAVLAVGVIAVGDATPLHYLFWNYVPLADAFRVPGRIVIMLPALLLLLLGWLFADVRRKPLVRTAVVATSCVVVFAMYQLWLSRYVPSPSYPVPAEFRDVPQTVAASISWIGAAVLSIAALYGLWPRARTVAGVVLCLLVVAQTGVVLRFGTWTASVPTTLTAAQMDAARVESLMFRGNPGGRTQSELVDRKMTESFIDGPLAKFYRRYQVVHSLQEAFDAMATSRAPDEIVIEGFERDGSAAGVEPASGAQDRVVLEEATFNRLRFSVDSPAAGFLSLTLLDRFRFKGFVNGEEVRSYRANGGERAVHLPPGNHIVEFRYWSPAAFAGVVMSLLTLCAFGVYIVLGIPRERKAVRAAVLVAALLVPAGLFSWWKHSVHHGEHLGTRFGWNSGLMPDGRNLAYGRKTRMNSVGSAYLPYNFYPGRGVDGDREGTSFCGALRKMPWWQVDLGSRQALGEVRIYRERGGLLRGTSRLQLLLSEDGSQFHEAGRIDMRTTRQPWTITLERTSARFVRLQQLGSGRLALNEVEVYGPRR